MRTGDIETKVEIGADGLPSSVVDDATGNVKYSQSSDASEDLFYDGFIISGRDISFAPNGIEVGQRHEIRRTHDDNFSIGGKKRRRSVYRL